jgi:hypothetical protein
MAGGQGGNGGFCTCCSSSTGGRGGNGGGVIRLIADSINVAGQVTANGAAGAPGSASYPGNAGGGGGGSGGGILLAADQLTVTGAISAAGGAGGVGTSTATLSIGGVGGPGRVKLLYGSKISVTGTITGTKTQTLLPPLTITSTTHPNPYLFYNDDFTTAAFTWNKAYPAVLGYYERLDTVYVGPPTPATGTFTASELLSFPKSSVLPGVTVFHLTSIDATSSVGTVESTFTIQINATPPTVSSTSHPSPGAWSTNPSPFFSWTVPNGDANYTGFYYVLDHYGTTVPKTTDTFLPITQKSLLRSGLPDGIWAFHVVTTDTMGYFTRYAGTYRVKIGADPGSGSITGHVVDSTSANVSGARVTINKNLFNLTGEPTDQYTAVDGTYGFPATVPAGTWEVTVNKGTSAVTQTVTVTKGVTTTLNFTLP